MKVILVQPIQDTLDVNLVVFQRIGEDEDIIEVDHYEDVGHILEDMVHKGLKHSGCIGEPHRHDQKFK